jgi:hypothetical protein
MSKTQTTLNQSEKPVTVFDQFKATMLAVYDGTASVAEYVAAYRRVQDAEAVKAELSKLTKDELIRTFRIAARPDEKKSGLIKTAHESMLSGFALGKSYGPNRYVMTAAGIENHERQKAEALDALVNGHTQADLAAFAAEAKAKREAYVEALKNPKTLEEFRRFMSFYTRDGKTTAEVRLSMLTPEQRADFDLMLAEEARGRRKASNDEQRTQVRVAGQTVDGNIIATKHTKKGHDLFVVQLAERVSREDYETLNAGAKKIGGYYSSFRGAGAVPGFQFTTTEQAQAFVTLAGGDASAAKEVAQERRDAYADDRSQTAVERLTEMANRMEADAIESLAQERKANTVRRARFAASAEASAQSKKALAVSMRNIADAINGGNAKFLDRVREKVQVELLEGYVRTASNAQLRAKFASYADQERHKGERPTAEAADYAEFPEFTAYRSDLASLGRKLLDVDGTKLLGQRMMKVADDVSEAFSKFAKKPGNLFKLSAFTLRQGDDVKTAILPTKEVAERAIKRSGLVGKAIVFQEKRGVQRIILSPSEAIARGIWDGDSDKRITLSNEFGAELVQKIGGVNRRGAKVSVPWQFESAYSRRKVLARMGLETPAEFRAALREFIALREQAAAPDKVKEMERAMIGRSNDGLDFFPTGAEAVDQMIEAADLKPGMTTAEPSAGWGHIAERIRDLDIEPDVVELSPSRRELLEAKGFNVVGSDFLQMTMADTPEGKGYARILMNPPYSDGRDILHVQHAFSLLAPEGRVVALMGESAFTNQYQRSEAFREWLDQVGGTVESLPAGSFNDPSLPVNTGANARMVVIDKPCGDALAVAQGLASQVSADEGHDQEQAFQLT